MILATLTAAGPRSATAQASQVDVSDELRSLYEADQADRRHTEPPTRAEWARITERDRERRNRVLAWLRGGQLTSGEEFFHAAMVLQHGESSDDVLLAHILATAAAFEGHAEARWLSAAALDRYLHRTGQPQRLGTQYLRSGPEDPYRPAPDAPWGLGPYEEWLPDLIRGVFDVSSLAEQRARVREMNGGNE